MTNEKTTITIEISSSSKKILDFLMKRSVDPLYSSPWGSYNSYGEIIDDLLLFSVDEIQLFNVDKSEVL